MTLADKLNRIIRDNNLTKTEFARKVGISENYIYILTGNSRPGRKENKKISPHLAKLIALEFGCSEQWLLKDDE